ncbi:small ubiquitin-related modifier 2-like isoform X2 [Zalophus californianus]|uniref:Small ubiquitin-related modifier 2-like isoform X2 n=1 Tax=Zalophus californianus TaxID=9704 RepID=A0A6J2DN71_ZALCA|nr:small ubiquitin-related modifier 2-like isoform X2 [Zalophus californianus]
MANEKPKEGVKTEKNNHINLKVAGQDGSVVQFKIKSHTPLSKLMKAYCERQGFWKWDNEDTTDVFQQQTGGVY